MIKPRLKGSVSFDAIQKEPVVYPVAHQIRDCSVTCTDRTLSFPYSYFNLSVRNRGGYLNNQESLKQEVPTALAAVIRKMILLRVPVFLTLKAGKVAIAQKA